MDFIRQYYFDFNVMIDDLSPVLDGFWLTLKLSILGGVFSLIWGLVLAVLRQLPGKPLAPIRWVTIGYIDVFRGIPAADRAAARLRWAQFALLADRRGCDPGFPGQADMVG